MTLGHHFGPSHGALAVLVVAALYAPRAKAACPATAADLAQVVNAAELSFSKLDLASFGQARDEAMGLVACLAEPISPAGAAAFHRMEGVAAFSKMDNEAAGASFRSAAFLQPNYRLPSDVAPAEGPLARLYAESAYADLSDDEPQLVAQGVYTLMDGLSSQHLPGSRAVVLQVLAADGNVTWSGYVRPGEPPPAIIFEPVPPPGPSVGVEARAPVPDAPISMKKPKTGRLVMTFGSGLAAAGLGVVALNHWQDYRTVQDECSSRTADNVCSQETVDLKDQNREKAIGFGAAAGVAGAMGIGLGVSLAF